MRLVEIQAHSVDKIVVLKSTYKQEIGDADQARRRWCIHERCDMAGNVNMGCWHRNNCTNSLSERVSTWTIKIHDEWYAFSWEYEHLRQWYNLRQWYKWYGVLWFWQNIGILRDVCVYETGTTLPVCTTVLSTMPHEQDTMSKNSLWCTVQCCLMYSKFG